MVADQRLFYDGLFRGWMRDNGIATLEEAIGRYPTQIHGDTELVRFDFPGVLDLLLQFHPKHARIASVGCSTGEEVYSIIQSAWHHNIVVHGYDINAARLDVARKGVYNVHQGSFYREHANKYPDELVKDELSRLSVVVGKDYTVSPAGRDMFRVSMGDDAKKRADFFEHDILAGPLPQKYNIIFVMNVLRYLSNDGVELALKNIRDSLEPNGFNFIVPEFRYDQQFDGRTHGYIELPLKPISKPFNSMLGANYDVFLVLPGQPF